MKRLLLPLLASLALPTAINASGEFEQIRKICALTMSGQITVQDGADQLGIKEPIDKFWVGKPYLAGAVKNFCRFYKGD